MAKRKPTSDLPVGRALALRRRRGESTTSTSHVPRSTQAGIPEPQESGVQQDSSVSQYLWVSCSPVAGSNSEPRPYPRRVQFEDDRWSALHGPPACVPSEMCSVFHSNPADEMTTNGAIPSNNTVPNPHGDVLPGAASGVYPAIDDNHPETVEHDAGPLDDLNNNPQDDAALAIPSDTRPLHDIGHLDDQDNSDMLFNWNEVQGTPITMLQSPLYPTGTLSSPVPSSRHPSWDSQTPRSTSLTTPLSFESAMALPPMTVDVVGPSNSGSALNIDFGPGNEYLAQYTGRVPSIEYPAELNRDQYSTNNSSTLLMGFRTLPTSMNQEFFPDGLESLDHGLLPVMDDIDMFENNLVNPDVQE